MYLRTVLRSMPSCRAMAETDRPCRCKFQDHDELPKFDHRAAPSRQREQHRRIGAPPTSRGMPRKAGSHENWGKFEAHKWGEFNARSDALHLLRRRDDYSRSSNAVFADGDQRGARRVGRVGRFDH